MSEIFSRNILYWGEENQKLLAQKHVAVFGLGGVGGFCAEALARAGVGSLTIVDFDTVSESNINRQSVAFHSSIGQKKTALFEKRLKDINPDIHIEVIDDFYTDNSRHSEALAEESPQKQANKGILRFAQDDNKLDYVADAIDTMRSKIHLLKTCYENKIPVISSMGAGNRIDPTQLYIADLKDVENRNAPFVSNVIYQLKKLGITEGITFVCSRETPHAEEKLSEKEEITTNSGEKIEFNKIIPSSTPFVASCSGIFMASYIVRKLIEV